MLFDVIHSDLTSGTTSSIEGSALLVLWNIDTAEMAVRRFDGGGLGSLGSVLDFL